MALSDREKQVLEELERNLLAEDPKLARKSRTASTFGQNSPAKIVVGALLGLIGISILVFAAATQLVFFGVAGFLITLFGILMASAGPARVQKTEGQKGAGLFEDRWNKRSDN